MSACPSSSDDDYGDEFTSNFSPNSTVIYDYYDLSESAGYYWQYDASIAIVKYVWPFIFIAGTVGNILTFIVLIRRRMQRTPVYFYLAMLACADTCVIYLSGAKTWLRVVTGLEILHLSDAACRICMFLFLQSLHLSAFFVVAMTTDRFFTVFFPLQRPRYRFLQKAKLFSFLAFILLAGYNCHIFWTFGLKIFSDGWKTCAPIFPSTFMCDVFPWLKLSLYTVVPFVLVLTLNCATVYKMYQTHSHFRKDSESRRSRISMGQYRVTIMLLGVSVSWLLLTAPFTLFIFISNAGETTGTTLEDDSKFFFFKTISFSLLYVNHGVNFYIYCLSGQRFRKEFLEVIISVRRWSVRSRMTSSVAIRASNREHGIQASNKPIAACIVENPNYEMKRHGRKSALKRKNWKTEDI